MTFKETVRKVDNFRRYYIDGKRVGREDFQFLKGNRTLDCFMSKETKHYFHHYCEGR